MKVNVNNHRKAYMLDPKILQIGKATTGGERGSISVSFEERIFWTSKLINRILKANLVLQWL